MPKEVKLEEAKAKLVEAVKEEKKSKKLKGVGVGQVVHYVSSGGINSVAFITRVHDGEIGIVNLFVIRDDAVMSYHFETSVNHSDEGETGTWHFIEKE